jgi:hypothetical protein
MTSEGLFEIFEGNFTDLCADKFPLMSMGGQQRVKCAQILTLYVSFWIKKILKLVKFLFTRISLVPIELIHKPKHVQIVFSFFYLPEFLKKSIGTRNGRNVSVSGSRTCFKMSVSGPSNDADPF